MQNNHLTHLYTSFDFLKVWDFALQIECLSIIRRNAKEKNVHKAKRVKNYQHFNKMDILTGDEGILMKS